MTQAEESAQEPTAESLFRMFYGDGDGQITAA